MSWLIRLRRQLHPRYASLPREWFKRPIRVLDAGAGPQDGILARSFLAPGSRFEAINIVPLPDDSFERQAFTVYTVADLNESNLSFAPEQAYDYVVCSHTIEHLRDGLALIPVLASKVAPGGRLYLEWPDPSSERFPLRNVGLHFRDDPTHIRTYSVASVARAVSDAGLVIDYMGRRRHWLRILLSPALCVYHIVRRRELKFYDLWDVTGFAAVVRGHRNS